jgi:hypothetical protein
MAKAGVATAHFCKKSLLEECCSVERATALAHIPTRPKQFLPSCFTCKSTECKLRLFQIQLTTVAIQSLISQQYDDHDHQPSNLRCVLRDADFFSPHGRLFPSVSTYRETTLIPIVSSTGRHRFEL